MDAAGNNHAQRMLLRDVANLRDFFGQFEPALLKTDFGPEIWSLYQAGLPSNDTVLTGRYERAHAARGHSGTVSRVLIFTKLLSNQ